jgi:hypothetical protein
MASTKKKKKIVTIVLPIIGKDKVNRNRLKSLLGSKNATTMTTYLETVVNNYAKTYHKNEVLSQICLINMNVLSKKNEKHIILTGYAVTERNETIQLETCHVQVKKVITNMTRDAYNSQYGR